MEKLPTTYKKYFWDCDFNKLNLSDHKEYVLSRLLAFGNLSAMHYIFNNFAKKEVTRYISVKGAVSLSRTNYLFWEKLLKHDELWKK